MSRPSITDYHRPADLTEAWDRVADGDPSVRLLSGGADLTIHAPPEVTSLVDVGPLLDVGVDREADGSLTVGPMTTLTDVMEHPDLAELGGGVIPEMMVHVGNPLLRNFSTIGGHLARGKLSDVLPVFLALDCEVTLFRGEETTLTLADYYEENHNKAPHILTGIKVLPLPEQSALAFLRFAKTVFDFPILNACTRIDLDAESVINARIICGATPRRAERASRAEAWLVEHGLTPEAIAEAGRLAREEVPTGGGWVASPEFRSHLVEVLTTRCLATVAERLEVS